MKKNNILICGKHSNRPLIKSKGRFSKWYCELCDEESMVEAREIFSKNEPTTTNGICEICKKPIYKKNKRKRFCSDCLTARHKYEKIKK